MTHRQEVFCTRPPNHKGLWSQSRALVVRTFSNTEPFLSQGDPSHFAPSSCYTGTPPTLPRPGAGVGQADFCWLLVSPGSLPAAALAPAFSGPLATAGPGPQHRGGLLQLQAVPGLVSILPMGKWGLSSPRHPEGPWGQVTLRGSAPYG